MNSTVDARRYWEAYEGSSPFGAKHHDLALRQYGVDRGRVVAFQRYFIYYQKLLGHLSRLVDVEGRDVLDVGCGEGLVGGVMARRARAYCCLDISPTRLKQTRRALGDGVSCWFVQADGCRLPFRDETFDVALATEVVEHVPNAHDLIADLVRVVRRGGHILVSTPNALEYRERPEALFVHEHVRDLSLGALCRLLEEHGANVVTRWGAGLLLPPIAMGPARLLWAVSVKWVLNLWHRRAPWADYTLGTIWRGYRTREDSRVCRLYGKGRLARLACRLALYGSSAVGESLPRFADVVVAVAVRRSC